MSRGFGRVQRALLVALQNSERIGGRQAADGLTTPELAVAIFDPKCRPSFGRYHAWHVGDAKMSAVRRALAGLARDGLAHQCKGPSGQYSARWRRGEAAAEK